MAQFRRLGLEVEALYAYLNWEVGVAAYQTHYTIRLALLLQVPRVVLDCEHTPVTDRQDVINQIAWCLSRIEQAGLEPVIYTGGWWWRDHLGNPTQFSHVPLWFSSYWSDYRVITEPGFGGWESAWAHQFTSTPPAPFRPSLDLNYVLEELPMTPDEKKRLERLEALIAGNGLRVAAHEDEPERVLRGEDALSWLVNRQVSTVQLVYNQNAALGQHVAEHPGGGEHEHRAEVILR